jgi:TolB-like protein/DNA-binding winged helix-turn-helix (wHTH) protein
MTQVPAEIARLYRFDEFVLDTESGELRGNGRVVRLQPQPLQILLLLLQHSGEIVTREQLKDALWARDTYVEFEDALNHAVRRLRTVLGDTAQVPRYVETLPRRGYRLIVPVETETHDTDTASVEVSTRAGARWPWYLAVAVALFLGMVGTMVYRPRSRDAAPPIRSLAVLPFTNLSGDPQQEYFADGLTDTLTAELSQIHALRVISRTSAMHYKGSNKALPEIANELGVSGILEGSVVRSGDRVRVTVQLIRAPSDSHVWARSYERDMEDILRLQSEMANAIAEGVRAQVTPEERIRLASLGTANPEAHDLYMQGRYWWAKRNQEGTRKAIECFERSIAADPGYALAYAGLADSLRMVGVFEVPVRKEGQGRRKTAAETAVRLDPDSAEAHTALAAVYQDALRWNEAGAQYRHALELNPNYAVAHHWFAGYLIVQGRLDEAMQHAIIAQQLDPLYLPGALTRANILRQSGKPEEADAQLLRVLQIDPDFLMAHCARRSVLEDQGRFPEAIDEGEKCALPADKKLEQERAAALRVAYAKAGSRGYWTQRLEFGRQDVRNNKRGGEFVIALAFAQLGDEAQAMAWLNRVDCRKMITLGLDEPAMKRFRSDPRFQQFLRCLQLGSRAAASAG